ncbi:MAG: MBL fold metallo-hydrolase [Desulfosporosinus sp. BRH_c37]|nr:MAG: MBL fold metallo-hydrolase [Desulfosporosinus sp. BRH_c37]
MLINKELAIHIVRLPLPFALNHINCYAIQGKDGWWLIDVGLNTESSRKVWLQFLLDNDIKGSDIKGIYITHAHPDHFAAAGWLQEISGAPVYISAQDSKSMSEIWNGSGKWITVEVTNQLNRNGMPPELIFKATRDIIPMVLSTQPHPALSIIEPGEVVQFGDFQYTTVFTPGHSDGHMCFFNQEHGFLFSGDHLLETISPNISLWPNGELDPLANFLESLNSNRCLSCKSVLPAHGAPFSNMELRISELEAHHHERLRLIKDSTRKESTQKSLTVYEICGQLFGQELNEFDLRFAMTETLAHLMYLVYRGEMEVKEHNGINLFV